MTYRELDEASNRLAQLLAGHGGGPGQSVALLFSRSAEAIVSILAVLKTGAAYLPIDPALPEARIGFVLGDAAPVAVITTADLADRLDGQQVVVIDVADPAVNAQADAPSRAPAPIHLRTPSTHPAPPVSPKGVAVTHRNVTSLLASIPGGLSSGGVWSTVAFAGLRRLGLGDPARCCMVAGWLWCPKTWRARREDLHALLVAERVSVLSQTPSAAGMLASDGLENRVGSGGGGMPDRAGRPLGARPGDDQRLRSDRSHCLRRDQCAVDGGLRCGANRIAGSRCGLVVLESGCAQCPPESSVSCMWPAPVWRPDIGNGPA